MRLSRRPSAPIDEEVEPTGVAEIGIATGPAPLEGDRSTVGRPDRMRLEVGVDEREPMPASSVARDHVEVAVARVEEEAAAVGRPGANLRDVASEPAKPAPVGTDRVEAERRGDRDQPAARRRRDPGVHLRPDDCEAVPAPDEEPAGIRPGRRRGIEEELCAGRPGHRVRPPRLRARALHGGGRGQSSHRCDDDSAKDHDRARARIRDWCVCVRTYEQPQSGRRTSETG